MVFEVKNKNGDSNIESIIIVDICEYLYFFIEFLKGNDYLRCSSVIDAFISEKFENFTLTDSQEKKLETKLAFKTRDMIHRSWKLGYIRQIAYSKYRITEKINNLEPLVLNLFNSRISSFTL